MTGNSKVIKKVLMIFTVIAAIFVAVWMVEDRYATEKQLAAAERQIRRETSLQMQYIRVGGTKDLYYRLKAIVLEHPEDEQAREELEKTERRLKEQEKKLDKMLEGE